MPKNPKIQIYPGSNTTALLMKLQQFRRMKIFACSFSCTCLFQSWRRPCWVETYLLKYLLSQNCLFTLSLALTPSLNIISCHYTHSLYRKSQTHSIALARPSTSRRLVVALCALVRGNLHLIFLTAPKYFHIVCWRRSSETETFTVIFFAQSQSAC